MTDPTEINSVYWNEEKKSWEHKMIQNTGNNMDVITKISLI